MQGYGGLLPKIISPTHYLKKVGLMPKKKAALVEEPAPALDPTQGDPQGQMILLGAAALGLVLLLAGSRK